MVATTRIDDPTDPRVADYRTLRDPELRKRYEGRHGVFIAEGPNVVIQLVSSDWGVRSVLLDERKVDEFASVLDGLGDVDVFVAARDVLYEIVAFRLHQGVVAVGERRAPTDLSGVLAQASRVLVLDAMNDHENMGSIFRTARAFDVDAVLLGPHSADPLYRRCVRVSMGHVLHVPFGAIGALPDAYDVLTTAGLRTVALTPRPDAPLVTDLDPTGRWALVLGAEGPGLSTVAIEAADVRARIPISADVDSLNVAVTAAVALHALTPG